MTRRLRGRWLALVAGAVVLVPTSASALLTRTAAVPGNAFSTATLPPPTGVAAQGSCNGLIVGGTKVTVTWTPPALAPALPANLVDGYDVLRAQGSSGGTFSVVAHLSAYSTSSYTDTNVSASTTYRYRLRSSRNNWRSADSSTASATTPGLVLGVCVG